MIKRATSLFLVLMMLLPLDLPVSAKEMTTLERAENLLIGLKIIEKNEADIFVTRARFADVFTRAMNIFSSEFEPSAPFSDTQDSEYYQAIEILHDRRYINGVGDNKFAPEDLMRTEDIARLYVCALGLETYPKSNNMSFWTAANRFGLLKGVSYTDNITMYNFTVMTYNLLVNAPVGKAIFSADKSYTIDYEDNLLYENFKVKKERGLVSENSTSGVWSKASAKKGYVKINLKDGTVTALEGDTDISAYLGYNLDVYIEYGDDNNRVICYEDNSDYEVCVIDIADIAFDSSTLSQISYTVNGARRKETIAPFPSVIFNDVYYDEGAFNLNTLKNYDGTVTLIKSEGSGDYDVIKIAAYTDYFVSNVEYYNGEMRVFDKGVNPKLVLNDSEGEIKVYYPNGAKASIYELQANMLLTVMKSADSSNIVIYIGSEAEENVITGINEDEKLVTTKDGKEYGLSASFSAAGIETGKPVKIYFDYFGKAGWIELGEDGGNLYAIVCSVKHRTKEDLVELKTFVKAGGFTTFTLAEKVKIDGTSCKSTDEQLSALAAVSIKGFETGTFPMRYELNEDGRIRYIDTPMYNKGVESKDSLRTCLEKSTTTSGVLFSSDGILAKKNILSAGAKVFVLPEDSSMLGNYEMFSAGGKSLLATGKNTNVAAYQLKENSLFADLVVIWKGQTTYAEINHDNRLFLIDKIKTVYDESAEGMVTEVTGIEGGVKKTYRTYSEFDTSKIAGLSRGDVVRFAYYNGAILNVEIVFQKDTTGANLGTYKQPSGANNVDNNEGNYDMYYCGYVRSREGKYLKIWTADITNAGKNIVIPKTTLWKNGDDTSEEYRVIQATNIAVYDPTLGANEQVYVGDIEDIPYYEGGGHFAVVITRYRSRSPQETVVIKQ